MFGSGSTARNTIICRHASRGWEEQRIKARRGAGAGVLACCWKRWRATVRETEKDRRGGSAVQSLACLDRFSGQSPGRIAAENKEATLPGGRRQSPVRSHHHPVDGSTAASGSSGMLGFNHVGHTDYDWDVMVWRGAAAASQTDR
jgi:hypothetical protein